MIIFKWERLNHQREIDEAERENFLRALPKVHAVLGQKRYEIGQILRELCRWKQVNLLEAEACPDHIHILVEIPPKISVSRVQFYGLFEGEEQFDDLREMGEYEVQI